MLWSEKILSSETMLSGEKMFLAWNHRGYFSSKKR